ncbi:MULTISPECIES: spore cortex biosynthesis protein YabQ [unclassified Virgibacillus]|uniref:spore cortex biosynthesis protein YabQ n=1 Tax=unclassified Virgibacillus TaxID=2620237 RepID=UPI0024DE4BAC|nr:spore cortex biosynthesis protein YabQ [Virgibacillus sp. LDC-1]
MTLSVQFTAMISMIISGFYLGLIRDTFLRFRVHWKSNTFLLYFLEVCFWTTQMFTLFYVLFLVNAGELRVYIFVACLLGFATYQAIAAKIYKALLEKIIHITTSIYHFFSSLIKTIIVNPIKFIIQLIIRVLVFFLNLLAATLLFIAKLLVFPVIWVLKQFYRVLPDRIINIFHKNKGFYSKIKNIYSKIKRFFVAKRR